jgi:glycosyltransferase involved in cell wall biosynthesis
MDTSLRVNSDTEKIAVVIPAYKVSDQIVALVKSIGPEVSQIIVVDDGCPDSSGQILADQVKDPRLSIIFHEKNMGVGAAVKTGYREALKTNVDVVIKLDGDGQMDPKEIENLARPITEGWAQYTKGNRFFESEAISQMPKSRVFGNLFLTFMTKFSTGYWRIFDPNNGYTAISAKTLKLIPLDKVDDRYFFESDMLFRLYLANAVVVDVPIAAIYGAEKSNLKIRRVIFEFPIKHHRNLLKRIAYSYYIREFNLASLELPIGLILGGIGLIRGGTAWWHSIQTGITAPTGTVVLSAVLILSSIQFILGFLNFDINNYPKKGS